MAKEKRVSHEEREWIRAEIQAVKELIKEHDERLQRKVEIRTIRKVMRALEKKERHQIEKREFSKGISVVEVLCYPEEGEAIEEDEYSAVEHMGVLHHLYSEHPVEMMHEESENVAQDRLVTGEENEKLEQRGELTEAVDDHEEAAVQAVTKKSLFQLSEASDTPVPAAQIVDTEEGNAEPRATYMNGPEKSSVRPMMIEESAIKEELALEDEAAVITESGKEHTVFQESDANGNDRYEEAADLPLDDQQKVNDNKVLDGKENGSFSENKEDKVAAEEKIVYLQLMHVGIEMPRKDIEQGVTEKIGSVPIVNAVEGQKAVKESLNIYEQSSNDNLKNEFMEKDGLYQGLLMWLLLIRLLLCRVLWLYFDRWRKLKKTEFKAMNQEVHNSLNEGRMMRSIQMCEQRLMRSRGIGAGSTLQFR